MLKFATAGNAENLKKLIAEFYCCKFEDIELSEEGAILKNGRKMSTKWTVKRGKYIFFKE